MSGPARKHVSSNTLVTALVCCLLSVPSILIANPPCTTASWWLSVTSPMRRCRLPTASMQCTIRAAANDIDKWGTKCSSSRSCTGSSITCACVRLHPAWLPAGARQS